MDSVYTITPSDCRATHSVGHSGSPTATSAWSRNNLLSFSWEKVVRGYIERYVSILDPNQPWNVHAIPFKSASVNSLQWNHSGKQLLCTTSTGICTVWTVSENLTNVWREKANLSSDLHGENILASSWFCNGRKVLLHPDKFNDPKEKLTRIFNRPTLSQLGGQPMEGYIVVTASGVVAVKCVTQNDKEISAKTRIKTTKNFCLADIAFNSQGNVVILATDNSIESPIYFWTIKLNFSDDTGRLLFEINRLPSIVLKCSEDMTCKYSITSHALFMPNTNADHVIVCASNTSGSLIESWLLKEEKHAPPDLHQCFSSQAGMTEKTKRWRYVLCSAQLPKILNISLPHLPISPSSTKMSNEKRFFNGIVLAIALPNNVIKILHRITLVELLNYQVAENITNEAALARKRSRKEEIVSSVEHIKFSPTSCALAVFDNHANLIMVKVTPWLQKAPASAWMANHLTQLLYFCVFTGQEWWDVLLHMQNSMVNTICDQLTQEFNNQPKPLQQMLKSRLLSVKITIYQQSQRNSDAIDCQLRLMFEAIIVVFRSLLRPPQDAQENQAPADKLHEVCNSSFESDISMLLQSVDADTKTLQALQQLIQWIADVTLYLLAIFPQVHSGSNDIPGSSLVRDKDLLVMLRELLVIIQMWRLLKSACAPVFCSLDDQIDCLPFIFKLLTEVWQALSLPNEAQGRIPEKVIDDCCLLPNRIIIPAIDIVRPVNGVLQRVNITQQIPRYEFGRRPHGLHLSNKFAEMDFLKVDDTSKVDNLRRVQLGVSPTAPLKICSRCGIVSLLNSLQESIEFWDRRFTMSCLCGGSWQKVDCFGK